MEKKTSTINNQILIIDGYHLLHKGYYGSLKRSKLPRNREGILINAVYTFVANINDFINSNKYRTIIVTFDVGKGCWRKELYPEYKAKRKDTPLDLIPQMQLVREFLTFINIPWYEKENFEGDDVMGTIAKLSNHLGYDVHILSNDKDTFQLINDKTSVIVKGNKNEDDEEICEQTVIEKLGCLPIQIPDLKSLMGDASDNIKGVRGMHYSTAIELLKKYQNIETVFQNIKNMDERNKERLLSNKEQILLNKKIATIQKNLKLGRIDFRPLKINYKRYAYFLKRERMWAFVSLIEKKIDDKLKIEEE
ncbi:DNA polymerase I [Spiroplasma sabaudiense Ar-1343]|uniref:5'-3' exonuclease n=1 Tax=Spiroplasma sabaudiense Ar-1343 TaxID=1276257 RepID=W6A8H5_9MOLU|nr:5'-3' exonuclease [Spiroplasma sabaudiense]AHI53468.1 DNA polymerase I [Spiroplasma sabaudiense Ar-1343]